MNGLQCNKKGCVYLHSYNKNDRIFAKELITSNKESYQEQEKLAFQISNISTLPLSAFLSQTEKYSSGTASAFPKPETIYYRRFGFLNATLLAYQQMQNLSKLNTTKTISLKADIASKPIKIETTKEKNLNEANNSLIQGTSHFFKFVHISEFSDIICNTDDIIRYDSNSLYDLQVRMAKEELEIYLSQYMHTIECIMGDVQKSPRLSIPITNGTPIYNWSYQRLHSKTIDAYDVPDGSEEEWNSEQYHVLKLFQDNCKGDWMHEEGRCLKRYDADKEKAEMKKG